MRFFGSVNSFVVVRGSKISDSRLLENLKGREGGGEERERE